MPRRKPWLLFAIITTAFWGLWGALIEIPEKSGFPATLGYTVWALTMILPSLIALWLVQWRLEYNARSVFLGLIIGLTGAGGQLVLFLALRSGPAYLVFPFISLSPVITIIMSLIFLKERTSLSGWIGIFLALSAIPLLSYQSADGNNIENFVWIFLSLLVFLAWGFQAFVMRLANKFMSAESIFFYMMVTGIMLIPFAIWMTDFSQPINWGFKGPWITGMIQILNAVGALMLVYAFRYGKAIIVSPMTNALAPVITIIISLLIYQVFPDIIILTGMILAILSAFLLAIENE
ncbi:MAG: DMT family transporter [Cyclobacteriaceae bacterium]|nr:DMT family transporter [Cyclobacteriaceae bacterium]